MIRQFWTWIFKKIVRKKGEKILILTLSDETYTLLMKLRQLSETTDNGDLIAKALCTYEYLQKQMSEGRGVVIMPAPGEQHQPILVEIP